MSKQKLGIIEQYSMEILEIRNKLNDLENNRVYEMSGAKMDGYLSTNVRELKKMISNLLHKIDTNGTSLAEELAPLFEDNKES
jgi:hypothetical protein